MTKTEKAVRLTVWCIVVLLGGYVLAKGMMKLRENPSSIQKELMETAYHKVGKEIMYWTMPDNHLREVSIPCLQNHLQDEPVVEDEETSQEMIHQYGDTIAERILTENQGDAIKQENMEAMQKKETEEKGIDEEQDTGQEASNQEKELPAWTLPVETTSDINLSMEKLNDFDYLLRNFFVVDPNTSADPDIINGSNLLEENMKLEEQDGPDILIYHTHSQEAFADSREGEESDTVVGIGDYLESILTDVYGYQVIHLRDTFDLVEGRVERSKAYNYALPVVEQVLAENPSIQVVIDLHRDGVPDDKHLVTEINGKPTAQIMMFNGLSKTNERGNLDSLPNPYIKDNLAFAFQLSYQAARYYPRFTRCIYLKGYRYNLHVRPRSILLEVGAQTNTVEEAKNAMEPFSVILNKVLKGE